MQYIETDMFKNETETFKTICFTNGHFPPKNYVAIKKKVGENKLVINWERYCLAFQFVFFFLMVYNFPVDSEISRFIFELELFFRLSTAT